MDEILFVARNVTQAQHMASILGQGGFRASVQRTPAGLTDSGCSHAVKLRIQRPEEAARLLRAEGLQPLHSYAREANGYRELKL